LFVTEPSEPRVVASATVPAPVVRSFEFASFSRTVIAEVLAPFATTVVGLAVTVDVESEAAPGTKSTLAVLVSALPFSVPETVAVPALVEEVSVAAYVPSPLSTTAVSVPRVVARATVPADVPTSFPFESLIRTVIEEVLAPLAVIEVGAALIVDALSEAAPGANVTLADCANAEPFRVPVTVAVPALVEEVSVAE